MTLEDTAGVLLAPTWIQRGDMLQGIDSVESMPEVLKRIRIRALLTGEQWGLRRFLNFGALPGTLFIYFEIFMSTVLIQYSSLVAGWHACCCAGISCCCTGKNLHRCFPAPELSWAEPWEGCRAGFEPGAAARSTVQIATPHPWLRRLYEVQDGMKRLKTEDERKAVFMKHNELSLEKF